MSTDLTGTRVDGYLLHEPIHKGGFSRVYYATGPDDKPVVFRILRKSRVLHPAARRRFAHGLDLLCRVEHPHIVRCLARGSHRWRPFAVLEFVEGKNLHSWIAGRDRFWLSCRFVAAAQLASALAYLHERRILFLDLKLENVLLSYAGVVKLTDFDLACTFDELPRWWTRPAGTPSYLAPEVLAGRLPSPASDVYAYGLVLRGLFPEKTGTPIDDFITLCLDPEPGARPTDYDAVFDAAEAEMA